MNISHSLRKVGAVAGSTLMLGMTLGSAASLADFPRPFVDADGQVQSQIVVGTDGKQADVVGAVNVASALGETAVRTEQRTATGAGAGWTATDGRTLDTRNDALRLLDGLDTVRETLTARHLSALSDATYTDDDGDETGIEHYLYPGSQQVTFGNGPDGLDDQDPVLHVTNPASPSPSDHLFQLQANLEDSVNFTDDAVLGTDIELFGTEYTVSQSDTQADELVLFGSTQSLSLSTSGQTSGTVVVDGSDHTVEIDGVNDGGVIYRVDGGTWQQDDATGQFTIDGETVRIDDVINRVDDAGSATFEIGSEELHLMDGEPVEDGDGNDVDGTYVAVDGGGGSFADASTIDLYVGADDDDQEYVTAGESYSHDLFGNVEFHLGGLNPDMADADDGLEVGTSADDTATVSFTDSGGDSATIGFSHTPDEGSTFDLADSDGDGMVVVEGTPVAENEYVPTDAGGFTHLWEVTSIDGSTSGISDGDEATISLQDAVSGQSVEVDLEAYDEDGTFATSGNEYYAGTEIIDGQTYRFALEGSQTFTGGDSDQEFTVVWGTDASVPAADGQALSSVETGGESGNSGAATEYPSLELDSGARLAFYDPSQTAAGLAIGTALDDFNTNEFFVDDATQSTEDANGYGDGDPIARVINQHDSTFDIASGDSILAFGANARYLDGGDNTYNAGDEVYIDDDQDDDYTGQADTQLAGTTLGSVGAGTDLTITNPWPGLSGVRFYDAGTSNLWEAGSDLIVTDDDADEDFTGQGDTALDADGSTSTGTGTPDAPTGDALVPFQASDRVVYNGTLTGSYDLWLDASSSNNDQYNSGTDTVLFDGDTSLTDGGNGTGAETNADLKYVDDSGTGAYDDAGNDEIWLDQGGNGTVSNAADTVLAGSASPAEGTDLATTNPFTTDPQVAFFDDGDNAWQSGNDLIVTDPHNGGTVSAAADTQVNAGTDGTFDATDGDPLLDLDESTYYAVDVDGNGIDSGDEIAFAIEGSLAGGDTVSVFPTTTRHTGSQPYTSSETVVSDQDDSGTYTSGDIIFGGTSLTTQRYSTDPAETDGLTAAAQTIINGLTGPAAVVIEPADDDEEQEVYTVTASWSTDEIQLDTPLYSEPAKVATADLESDSDVTAGYDVYGSYSWYDSDGQGEALVAIPDGQAAAGAGFTAPGGAIDAGGSAGESYTALEGRTSLPNMARLDTEVTDSVRSSNHLILVGGPAVNQLVADLASDDKTWTQQEWLNNHEDEALLQTVDDAFASGQHSLIVAGYGADDTRAAARYIAEYGTHEQALADAENRLVLSEADYPAER